MPTDPEGTLDAVRGGALRVGVSANEPWVQTHDNGEPTGSEAELVRAFARSLDAEIQWSEGGEEALVEDLEHGEVDMVIGGITAKTPWVERAAVTQPYVTVQNTRGKAEEHVMMVHMGENAFLVELEDFLLGGSAP